MNIAVPNSSAKQSVRTAMIWTLPLPEAGRNSKAAAAISIGPGHGTQIPKLRTKVRQRKLRYASAQDDSLHIPNRIAGALQKSVHPDPLKRYDSLSEFTADLRTPNTDLMPGTTVPLAQRNPVVFWQVIAAILALIIVVLGARLA